MSNDKLELRKTRSNSQIPPPPFPPQVSWIHKFGELRHRHLSLPIRFRKIPYSELHDHFGEHLLTLRPWLAVHLADQIQSVVNAWADESSAIQQALIEFSYIWLNFEHDWPSEGLVLKNPLGLRLTVRTSADMIGNCSGLGMWFVPKVRYTTYQNMVKILSDATRWWISW